MKHKQHKKKRLYARDQASNARQWESTNIFLCECGAILEANMKEAIVT